jgi:hypothetical protein
MFTIYTQLDLYNGLTFYRYNQRDDNSRLLGQIVIFLGALGLLGAKQEFLAAI